MKWLYPELEYWPREERKAALRGARKSVMNSPRWGGVYIILTTAVLCALFSTDALTKLVSLLPTKHHGILLTVAIVILINLAVYYLWREPMRRTLRKELQILKVAICLKCGYDLRGQTEPRCPECGASFDEQLLKRDD